MPVLTRSKSLSRPVTRSDVRSKRARLFVAESASKRRLPKAKPDSSSEASGFGAFCKWIEANPQSGGWSENRRLYRQGRLVQELSSDAEYFQAIQCLIDNSDVDCDLEEIWEEHYSPKLSNQAILAHVTYDLDAYVDIRNAYDDEDSSESDSSESSDSDSAYFDSDPRPHPTNPNIMVSRVHGRTRYVAKRGFFSLTDLQ